MHPLQSRGEPKLSLPWAVCSKSSEQNVSPLGIHPNGSFFLNSDFLSLRKEESYGELIRPIQKKVPDLLIPKEQIVVLHSHVNKNTIQ